MIINEIPTRIKIQVEDDDENSETGLKEIETKVICVSQLLMQTGEESNEVIVFVSYDKDGVVHGRPLDKVKIIETRKYEESQNRSTRNTPKKRRITKGKSTQFRDNYSGNKAGNENEGESSSDRNRNREQTDGSDGE